MVLTNLIHSNALDRGIHELKLIAHYFLPVVLNSRGPMKQRVGGIKQFSDTLQLKRTNKKPLLTAVSNM